jgi:integrase
MIRRRGKGWQVDVCHGFDETGNRVRIRRAAHTRREAQELEARLRHELSVGAYLPDSDLTLAQFLERWLKDVVNTTVSEKTRENYTSHVHHHIIPRLGRLPLSQLSPPVIQRFCSALHETGLAPLTVALIYRTLRAALNRALLWRLLRENPARGVSLPRVPRKMNQVISVENLKRLLAAPKHDWLRLCVLIAATTGLRRGEILGLHWEDVDWDAAALHVHRSRTRVGSIVSEGATKTQSGERSVPLPGITRLALKEHRERQENLRRFLGSRYLGGDLIITSETSRPVDPTWLSNEFRALCKQLAIATPRLHSLRHTYATMLMNERKLPAHVVSGLLGHSSVAITVSMYGHPTDAAREEAAGWWDQALGE